MKSLAMKSLLEKFPNEKLGPVGKMDRPLPPPAVFSDAIAKSKEEPTPLHYLSLIGA